MLWLGSADANFVNGEVVVIDGGWTVTSNGYNEYYEQARSADDFDQNE